MPRIRTLKPEHRQHRKVGALTHRQYRLWVGCICEADDEGRFVAEPAQLRTLVFGYHPAVRLGHVADDLSALEKVGLIRLYVDFRTGTHYGEFPSWNDHQVINKSKRSKLPSFKDCSPAESGSDPVAVPSASGTDPVGRDQGKDQGTDQRRDGESLGEGSGVVQTPAAAPPSPPPAVGAGYGGADHAGRNIGNGAAHYPQRRRPAPDEFNEIVERCRRENPGMAEDEIGRRALAKLNAALVV